MKVCIQVKRDEKGWYTAVCPGLPGCLSKGRSCREAVLKIEDAIKGYMASIGEFVPEKVEHEPVEEPAEEEAM